MGSIKIRNGASGQVDNIDETATPKELRKKWGLSPDFSFVNDQGQRIPEDHEIGRYVKEDENVTPLAEPRLGASPSLFFVYGWDERKTASQFQDLKKEFYTASISPDYTMILIPNFPIDTGKFNRHYTRLLVSFNRQFQWMSGPAAYVDRDLLVYGKKSKHLDEFLTEAEMLRAGYVKICIYNPVRTVSLVTILKNIVNYLEALID